jgi:hypothetical protein
MVTSSITSFLDYCLLNLVQYSTKLTVHEVDLLTAENGKHNR